MKARILWENRRKKEKPPFNGEYFNFDRIPNRIETITFSDKTYIVEKIDTEIIGQEFFYTIYIDSLDNILT